jgi:hypothetical protein
MPEANFFVNKIALANRRFFFMERWASAQHGFSFGSCRVEDALSVRQTVLAPVPFLSIRTGQKFAVSCYAKSGYMRQDLEFGAAGALGARRAASRRDDPTRIVILRRALGRRTSLSWCFCTSGGSTLVQMKGDVTRTTNRGSKITAFLIDTPKSP